MIKYNDFSRVCLFYTLSEIEKAYKLGGEAHVSWNDYSYERCKSVSLDECLDAYHADFEKWWKKLPLEEQKRIHFEVKCKHIKIHLNWSVPKDFDPAIHNMPPTEIEYPNMAFPTKEFRSLSHYVYWIADDYTSKNGFHFNSYKCVMC